ncbi:MAG TPA: hypothetical protein VEX68_02415 [Bryobacteraceae bacterium]|nr:hypothetical protein [Bryobacteraceae bacterium]
MARYKSCWKTDPSEGWRLIAAETDAGWIAIVYDRAEKREAYRASAADENEAKVKARHFIVGVVPPITFSEGSTLELKWVPCSDEDQE